MINSQFTCGSRSFIHYFFSLSFSLTHRSCCIPTVVIFLVDPGHCRLYLLFPIQRPPFIYFSRAPIVKYIFSINQLTRANFNAYIVEKWTRIPCGMRTDTINCRKFQLPYGFIGRSWWKENCGFAAQYIGKLFSRFVAFLVLWCNNNNDDFNT